MANEHYTQIILSSSSEGFELEREKDLHRLFYTWGSLLILLKFGGELFSSYHNTHNNKGGKNVCGRMSVCIRLQTQVPVNEYR